MSASINARRFASKELRGLLILQLGNPTESARQIVIAHRLDVIDKWGRIFTVIAAACDLLLAIGYTYQTWAQATKLGI